MMCFSSLLVDVCAAHVIGTAAVHGDKICCSSQTGYLHADRLHGDPVTKMSLAREKANALLRTELVKVTALTGILRGCTVTV